MTTRLRLPARSKASVGWAGAYLTVGLAVALTQPEPGPAAWYPALGVGVVMIWYCGLACLPLVAAVELVVGTAQHGAVAPGLVAGASAAAEVAIVVLLLRRWRFDPRFRHPDDVVGLLLTTTAATLLGAALGAPVLRATLLPDEPVLTTARLWFVGDLTGILVLSPLLFLVTQLAARGGVRRDRVARGERLELGVVTVGGLVLTAWAFARATTSDGHFAGPSEVALMVLCLLPVLWTAIRFGRLRTAVFSLAVSVTGMAAFGSVSGRGITFGSEEVIGVQVLVAAVTVAGLLVATAVDAHRAGLRDLQAVLDASPVAVVSLDLARRATAWNEASERIFGWPAEEVLGRIPPMVPPDALDAFMARGPAQLAGPTRTTTRYQRRDGTLVEGTLSTNPLRDGEGRPVGVVGVIEDVTEHLQLRQELTDERSERQSLIAALADVEPGATPRETAAAVCRAATTVADVDGAVILQEAPDGGLTVLALCSPEHLRSGGANPPVGTAIERIRALSAGGPWWIEADPAHRSDPLIGSLAQRGITAVGGAPIQWEGRTIGHLLCGTTRQQFAGPERRVPLFSEVATYAGALLGHQLRAQEEIDASRERLGEVIEDRRFHPVYQPVVDLADGSVVGFEALTRFDDGTPPHLVFAEAGRVGVGHELERACLAAAVRSGRDLPVGPWLSLNVSPTLVLEHGLGQLLDGADRSVVLEITEHAPVDDYAELNHALAALPGVRVSVDDAGAGYASLNHILELQPDIVKLDIGLVRGIDEDPARQALVAGMRYFAERTRTDLLAEGVETGAEAEAVRSLGVRLAQGYRYGRPAPVGDVIR